MRTHVRPRRRHADRAPAGDLGLPRPLRRHARLSTDRARDRRGGRARLAVDRARPPREPRARRAAPPRPDEAARARARRRRAARVRLRRRREPDVHRLPLVGEIAAGGPLLAEQNVEDYLAVPEPLARGGDEFLLRVKGESMIDAGILDGDYRRRAARSRTRETARSSSRSPATTRPPTRRPSSASSARTAASASSPRTRRSSRSTRRTSRSSAR